MALTNAERLQMVAIALMKHNVIGSSGSGSGGSNALIYDIAPVDARNLTYTAPVAGDLFYIGAIRDDLTNYVLPAGFTTLVAKNFSHERRTDSLVCRYQLMIVAKKAVAAEDELTFVTSSISGMLVLAASGTVLTGYDIDIMARSIDTGTSNLLHFENANNFIGMAFMSWIVSTTGYKLTETAASKRITSIITNNADVRGAGIYRNLAGPQDIAFGASPADFGAAILGVQLSASGTAVSSVDAIGVSIENEVVFNFVAGSKTYTATLTGYAVFVGGYRSADGFQLSGFTILKSNTRTVNTITQSEVIAIKAVTLGETVSWTSTDRSGGVFYETYVDLSARSYTTGDATKGATEITFPMVADLHTMFGIIGFAYSGTTVACTNNNDLRILQSATSGRLTTFTAIDFVQVSGEDNIAFSYKETYENDKEGIWVDFH